MQTTLNVTMNPAAVAVNSTLNPAAVAVNSTLNPAAAAPAAAAPVENELPTVATEKHFSNNETTKPISFLPTSHALMDIDKAVKSWQKTADLNLIANSLVIPLVYQFLSIAYSTFRNKVSKNNCPLKDMVEKLETPNIQGKSFCGVLSDMAISNTKLRKGIYSWIERYLGLELGFKNGSILSESFNLDLQKCQLFSDNYNPVKNVWTGNLFPIFEYKEKENKNKKELTLEEKQKKATENYLEKMGANESKVYDALLHLLPIVARLNDIAAVEKIQNALKLPTKDSDPNALAKEDQRKAVNTALEQHCYSCKNRKDNN